MLLLFLQSVTDTWEMIDHRHVRGHIGAEITCVLFFGISDFFQKSDPVNYGF